MKKAIISFCLVISMLFTINVVPVSANTLANGNAKYQGVDIYNGTSQVDWPVLAQEKQFVYIKAEEGEHTYDSYFYNNLAGAKSVGMAWGPYHFFHVYGVSSAKYQAQYFWSRIKGTNYSLYPVVDVELTDLQNAPEINADVKAFCEEFKSLSGYKPVIYTYTSFANQFLTDDYFKSCKLWIADYRGYVGDLKTWNAWDAWQYSSTGRIAGIHNYADLDIATDNIFIDSNSSSQIDVTAPKSNDVYAVGSLPCAINAYAGTDLDVRNSDGSVVPYREVSKGDPMIILDVNYASQLAEVLYPSYAQNTWMHGYIRNLQNYIHDAQHYKWHNGSTNEIVYDKSGNQIGTIYPYEVATPLYKTSNGYMVLYNTSKGMESKSGIVQYIDGFRF